MLLVNKMEMKLKSACFLPAVRGRRVLTPWLAVGFSLMNASATGFVRRGPGPQRAVIASCGVIGPFGQETSACLWAQGQVAMLSSPLACFCSKHRSFLCHTGPCCSLYWGAQGGGGGQWPAMVAKPTVRWSRFMEDNPALQLYQHLVPGFVMVQKLWSWGDVFTKVVALVETFTWWQLLGHFWIGHFSPRRESGCATVSGSSAVPVDHATEQLVVTHQALHAGRGANWSSFLTTSARRSMRPGQVCQWAASSPGLLVPLDPCFSLWSVQALAQMWHL